MKTILNDSKDPTFNLALEEYVLKELDSDEDFVLLWQNANSVIIGRNQNTYEEVNHDLVKKHDVKVVRRITGGGAVYHDLGNLNFSFITKSLKDNLNNYRKFTDPVIKVLNELGVPAEFQGRNDIVVDGKKISGNAQAWHKNKMLHHGTILFDTNLDFVASMLNVKQDKIKSKGIKSNRARVTNIKPMLAKNTSLFDFKVQLLKSLLNTEEILDNTYPLSNLDMDLIMKLQIEKYHTWEWNYQESPISSVIKEKKIPSGKFQFYFDIEKGLIKNINLFGDFLNLKDINVILDNLNNTKYDLNACLDSLKSIRVNEIIKDTSNLELISCLF